MIVTFTRFALQIVVDEVRNFSLINLFIFNKSVIITIFAVSKIYEWYESKILTGLYLRPRIEYLEAS